MRLPEVTQNAGGGPLWGEDTLGNGWFIPLTRRISAVVMCLKGEGGTKVGEPGTLPAGQNLQVIIQSGPGAQRTTRISIASEIL